MAKMANLWRMPLLAFVLTVGLAGCGRTTHAPTGPAPAGEGFPVPATCPAYDSGASGPTPPAQPVPLAELRVAWVLRCSSEVRTQPDGTRWVTLITERADTSAADLIAQLRQPSDPQASGNQCTAELVKLPYFVLVDEEGHAVTPKAPTDSCGRPKVGVSQALTALTFRTIQVTPARQLSSGR